MEITLARRGHSRIPWVRRKEIGRMRAYCKTLGLVLRHPGTLAAEAEGPVERRAAVRFARVSLALATVIGAAAVIVAFWGGRRIQSGETDSYAPVPVAVLMDTFWSLVPLCVGLWAALRAMLCWIRAILASGTDRGVSRARVWRASFYVAGVLPIMALLLAPAFAGAFAVGASDTFWSDSIGPYSGAILSGACVLAFLAWVLMSITGIALVTRWGRSKVFRGTLILASYPASFVVAAVTIGAMFWICGYVAIAVMSMTH